jgi:type IV pilus assembly protein PilN
MIVSPLDINLASQPFRRERAANAGLAAISLGLLCSLLILIGLVLHARSQAADLRRIMNSENAQLRSLQGRQNHFSAILAKPENADVFATNVFLNELIAKRSVSWTRVFSDLQTVMPGSMRLLAIRLPQVATEDASGTNRVQLDMVLGSERPDAVIELLKRLQESALFGPASVVSETPPNQNDPLFKYKVTVAYAQKL